MGKNWWRQATGLSNAQRQASRKLGIPLSGRPSRRKLFPAKGGRNSNAGCVVLLLALLAALGSAIAIGCSPVPNATAPPPRPARADLVTVGANTLHDEYRKNPVAADQKYKNKWLLVNGRPDITRDHRDRNIIALAQAGDRSPHVVGYIPERTAAQFVGLDGGPLHTVPVVGFCTGRVEEFTSLDGFVVVLIECEIPH